MRYLVSVLLLLGALAPAGAQPTGGTATQAGASFVSLRVAKSGSGSGTITGAGPINCGTQCDASYVTGVTVRLVAVASSGSTFTGWSGACEGTGTCAVTMSAPQTVTATFAVPQTVDRYAGPSGTGSPNDCTSYSSPCHIARLMQVLACGETAMLRDGEYTGSTNNAIDLYNAPPAHPTCTADSQIRIVAETDGGVFINGDGARATFNVAGVTYWNFEGFDAGNSGNGEYPGYVGGTGSSVPTTNSSFKRMCFSNAYNEGVSASNRNLHVFGTSGVTNSLFEDICAHGWGRNTLLTNNDFGEINGNTYRRFWLRFEGYVNAADNYVSQVNYLSNSPASPASGNNTYENFIVIHSGEQNPSFTGAEKYMGMSRRWTSLPDARVGFVLYAYSTSYAGSQPFYRDVNANGANEAWTTNAVDMFADARSHSTVAPIHMDCSMGANPTKCATNSADRLTAIRASGGATSIFNFQNTTNTNECTSLASCPNFYTGVAQGGGSTPGARNCFAYSGGSLTSTPLWPWPMDDRIKASLARANAAGKGGTALAGTTGIFWAANTVTSEIVSRYGAIPVGCMSGSTLRLRHWVLPFLTSGVYFLLAGAALARRRRPHDALRSY
jgi:hypothetical protein